MPGEPALADFLSRIVPDNLPDGSFDDGPLGRERVGDGRLPGRGGPRPGHGRAQRPAQPDRPDCRAWAEAGPHGYTLLSTARNGNRPSLRACS